MSELVKLQQVVNDESKPADERKQAAELILKLRGENPAYIPDDDPELKRFWITPDSKLGLEWPFTVNTLADAKEDLAFYRKTSRLKATIIDESLPKEVRINAAQQWKEHLGPRSNWNQFPNEELLQRLAPHPHMKRLEELNEFISYRPQIGEDVEEYLKSRRAALAEFRALKNQYPLHDAPYGVVNEPEISYRAQNIGATQKQCRELLGR